MSGPARADRADLLARVPLFAGLDAGALQQILDAAHVRQVPAAGTFFHEGDPSAGFFVLESGTIKLTQLTPEGHQIVLRLLGPGDAFGGVAAFSGGPYPVTGEAITDAAAREGRSEGRRVGKERPRKGGSPWSRQKSKTLRKSIGRYRP
jgi:hypothetical protein